MWDQKISLNSLILTLKWERCFLISLKNFRLSVQWECKSSSSGHNFIFSNCFQCNTEMAIKSYLHLHFIKNTANTLKYTHIYFTRNFIAYVNACVNSICICVYTNEFFSYSSMRVLLYILPYANDIYDLPTIFP